jgi:glutathione S-transferase
MELPAVVTILALVEYMVFTFRAGFSRSKFGVVAPATSGNPEWERLFRVQQNTLEQLIVFIPVLWIFSYFVSPFYGAAIGCVLLVGRILYSLAYVKEPSTRAIGFVSGFLTTVVLLVGSLIGIGMSLAG